MSTNPETIIARINIELRQTPNRDMTAETWKAVNEVRQRVLTAMEGLRAKSQAILDDRSLSPEGQRTKIATAALAAVSDYQFLERIVDQLDKAFANSTLFTVKPLVSDPVLRQLRNREVRDDIRGLNHAERDTRFIQATQQDDDETLDAMLDAPGVPLVTPDVKRRALDARAKRRQPQAYGQWEQDMLYRDQVDALREHVAVCLISMTQEPKKIHTALGPTPHYLHKEAPKRASETLSEMTNLVHSTM